MYGLRKHEIEKIIRGHLDKNPDLKYYIDNDYIDELVTLLIEGVSAAIEENTRQVLDKITEELSAKI